MIVANEYERRKWTGNKIGYEGALKMSVYLKINSTLTSLDLSCVAINKDNKQSVFKE